MNKKLKIFIAIIYYVVMMGIGIVMSILLPTLLVASDVPAHIEEHLKAKEPEYEKAIKLLVGYYDDEIAYQKDFEDGYGIVLFRTLVTIPEVEEVKADDKITYKETDYAHLAYAGFLYNVQKKYNTEKIEDNQTRLVANYDASTYDYTRAGENTEVNVGYEILSYDSDKDGSKDQVITLVEYNYVYFEITKDRASELKNVTFLDCNGEVFLSHNLSDASGNPITLDFSNAFFKDLEEFVTLHNGDRVKNKERLIEIDQEFLNNAHYHRANTDDEKGSATTKSVIIVIIYFVLIYLGGDLMFGPRYSVRLVKWIIRKIKGKEKVEAEQIAKQQEVYGTDYYTQLTVTLKMPEGCDISATVHYHNETAEIDMIFTPENKYTVTQRVHAGVYMNARLEAPGLEAEEFPRTLTVRGFRMNVEISMKDAKEN